jgi:hypothetical protein
MLAVSLPVEVADHDNVWIDGPGCKFVILSQDATLSRRLPSLELVPHFGPSFISIADGTSTSVYSGPRLASPGLPIIHSIEAVSLTGAQSDQFTVDDTGRATQTTPQPAIHEGTFSACIEPARVGKSSVGMACRMDETGNGKLVFYDFWGPHVAVSLRDFQGNLIEPSPLKNFVQRVIPFVRQDTVVEDIQAFRSLLRAVL